MHSFFMKNPVIERNLVALLFILVLITFSFAHRDSKRLERLYTLKFEKKSPKALVQNETTTVQQAN